MTDVEILRRRLHQQAFAPTLAALHEADDIALWPFRYARPHVSWCEWGPTGLYRRTYSFLSSQSFTVMITRDDVLLYQSTVYVSDTRLDVYVAKNERGWRMDTLTFPRARAIVERYLEDARRQRQARRLARGPVASAAAPRAFEMN